jgi:hypothetical protein
MVSLCTNLTKGSCPSETLWLSVLSSYMAEIPRGILTMPCSVGASAFPAQIEER